jgi:hypothetical protein
MQVYVLLYKRQTTITQQPFVEQVFVITIHYFCFELQSINSQNFHHFITTMPAHSKTIRITSDVSFSFEL